jgi:hypothetical protein
MRTEPSLLLPLFRVTLADAEEAMTHARAIVTAVKRDLA